MGLKYSSFAIRGIDVSQFNGVIDWSKIQADFVGIRVGYGNTIDTKFVENISNAQKKDIGIMYYWYMDYYNNRISTSSVNGMSDEAWGAKQAENCWSAIKSYKSGTVFIDIESTNGTYAPKIETVFNRAQTIAKSFLERLDSLNKSSNGIYCSLGMLSLFNSWFKDRPLWVAWYPYRTSLVGNMAIVQMCIDKGWNRKPLIWQYASDGMVNDDGIKAGIGYFGTQMAEMDLNGWVGTEAEYAALFGATTPDDETEVIPVSNTRTIEVKTTLERMNVRTSPKIGWNIFKVIDKGVKVDCLERKVDSLGNIWQRVGIDQYVAEVNNGIQYLK
jgi:GH25 family lysozyme M1 (1,4-beta-N-acetylmuramidase)